MKPQLRAFDKCCGELRPRRETIEVARALASRSPRKPEESGQRCRLQRAGGFSRWGACRLDGRLLSRRNAIEIGAAGRSTGPADRARDLVEHLARRAFRAEALVAYAAQENTALRCVERKIVRAAEQVAAMLVP